eukprot:12961662-Alexandrium_andersonii.AAC.1
MAWPPRPGPWRQRVEDALMGETVNKYNSTRQYGAEWGHLPVTSSQTARAPPPPPKPLQAPT